MHTYVGFAKYTYMYTLLLVLAPSPPMHAPIPLASGPLLVLVGTVPPPSHVHVSKMDELFYLHLRGHICCLGSTCVGIAVVSDPFGAVVSLTIHSWSGRFPCAHSCMLAGARP